MFVELSEIFNCLGVFLFVLFISDVPPVCLGSVEICESFKDPVDKKTLLLIISKAKAVLSPEFA